MHKGSGHHDKGLMWPPVKWALVLPVLLALSVRSATSCSPRIIQPVTHTRIEYRDRIVRDSLFFRDSVFIKESTKGDTVYVDKVVCQYRYKDKIRVDTLLREVHDTTTVITEVERRLTPVQSLKQDSFWWLVALLAFCIGWIFRKSILKLLIK